MMGATPPVPWIEIVTRWDPDERKWLEEFLAGIKAQTCRGGEGRRDLRLEGQRRLAPRQRY